MERSGQSREDGKSARQPNSNLAFGGLPQDSSCKGHAHGHGGGNVNWDILESDVVGDKDDGDPRALKDLDKE